MLLLAATSVIRDVPTELWVKLGLGVAILIGCIVLLRKLAQFNKVVLGVVVFIALTFIGFNWIYERNEPAWATPAVRWLGNYFPSKAR